MTQNLNCSYFNKTKNKMKILVQLSQEDFRFELKIRTGNPLSRLGNQCFLNNDTPVLK